MEMIDVLNKLQEIADKSPEVAKAVENVEKTTEVKKPKKKRCQKKKNVPPKNKKLTLTTKTTQMWRSSRSRHKKPSGINIWTIFFC